MFKYLFYNLIIGNMLFFVFLKIIDVLKKNWGIGKEERLFYFGKLEIKYF